MRKGFDARRLDVRKFAEEGGKLAGDSPLSEFPRLLGEVEGRGPATPVHWSAQGELLDAERLQPQVWLHLEAEATLRLTCQRCLADVDIRIPVKRSFRFVADEAAAAAEDDEAEEDVLAESRAFNLHELVEDELLMGVPVAPRHMVCPVLPSFSAGQEEFDAAEAKRENPFAVLQSLKPGKPGGR